MNPYFFRWTATLLLFVSAGCGDCSSNPPVDAGSDFGFDADGGSGGDVGMDVSGDAGPDAATLDCGESETSSAEVDGWTVELDHRDGTWRLYSPDSESPLLEGPPSCDPLRPAVRIANGAPSVQNLFGSFRVRLEGGNVNLSWDAPEPGLPSLVTESDGTVRLVWALPGDAETGGDVALAFREEGDDRLRIEVETSEAVDGGELNWACAAEESFFGLGTQVTGMELRGRTYPLWTQEQGNGKPEGGGIFPLNNIPEAAYAPMGVWHSSLGWSAILTHDAYSEIDLCETSEDTVSLRSYANEPGFVVVTGATPRERLTTVTEYTGRLSPSPPDWVFGVWVDAVEGPWRITQVADALRDNGIPASAIWTEDWIGGEEMASGFRLSYEWSWDQQTYPNLPETIADLHDRGFAFLGYFNPFIPTTVSTWDEAVQNGYTIEDESGEPYIFQDPAFRDASMIDLTDPAAVEWLQGFQKTAAQDLGIDGWMADFAEWLPVDARLESGVDAWNEHNRYPLEWQRVNRESLTEVHTGPEVADNDWSFFVRSGWASVNGGTAGTAPAMWAGDQDTDWGYDDGFPTIIPIGAHVGLAGVAIFGSDIAGYNSLSSDNTDKELFFRWSSAAAFHPLMRTHHGGDACLNWHFDRDADTLAHFGRWARIHAMLFPYFRSLIPDAMNNGWPMTRHPFLVEPGKPALWQGDDYVFFLGDDILVAPVLEKGATERAVDLPGTGWWPIFGDASVDSETTTATADVTEVPIFVRPGRALVLLEEAPDSFYGATDPGVTGLADLAGRLRVALYPDAQGQVAGMSESLEVSGSGWISSPDLTTATLDGTDLPGCALVGTPRTNCVDLAADVIRLFDVAAAATLNVDGATLDLLPGGSLDVTLGVAGRAWEALADATTYSGPNSSAPSWCDGNPNR